MSSYLRPDEEAAEAKVRRAQTTKNVIHSGVSSVAGAYGLSKVMPFLSEYIPENLALKGINKVFPQLGKFLKQGMDQGLSLKSGLDFVKDEAKKTQTKENRNIIEQYSPELHQFIKEKVDQGEDPLRAGAAAVFSEGKKFEKIIQKMEKDHKTPFSSILQTVYGQGKQSNQPQQSQNINDAFSQMGGGITDSFYKGVFDSLKQGKNTFSGVKEPLLSKAKPLFDQGLIKSPEDLKLFANGKLNLQGQQQGIDPQLAQILQQGNQLLQKFRGR